jgi:4-amino-4-deoxy-L-arabinose transferase-like glycosyltransferase
MTPARQTTLADWLAFSALAFLALFPALRAGNSDFIYADASRHAMDGVFVRDALAELPLSQPYEWAKEYYLRSPALGIGRYPPLVALIQAPFYELIGVCPLAGRLAGSLVWLGGLLFLYETARARMGRAGAVTSAAAIAAAPASVLWGSDVMLELPAIAFLMAGGYLYLRYLDHGGRLTLAAAAAIICLAGWVKQPAVLLLVAVVIHLLICRGFSGKTLREYLPAVTAGLILLVPLAILTIKFGDANVAIVKGLGRSFPFWSFDNWAYYLRQVPRWYVGWPLTVICVLGIPAALRQSSARRDGLFFALWAAVFYVFFTLVGLKSWRLAMLWMPAFGWFAGLGISVAVRRASAALSWAPVAAGFLAVTFTFGSAVKNSVPRGNEIASVAQVSLMHRPERILYVGPQNGTFIFAIRALSGTDRPTVIRDSKVFYHDFIAKELGRVEEGLSYDQIRAITERIAPDVVVFERSDKTEGEPPAAVRLFSEYLKSADFDGIAVIRRNARGWDSESFEVFKYIGLRKPGEIPIPMPGVGMDLEL